MPGQLSDRPRLFDQKKRDKGAVAASFSPLSLSPALWIDPSDAASVTISGSSGAYIGPTGLVLPSASGNYATAPSIGAYLITDDVEIVIRVRATDWTPAGDRQLVKGSSGYFCTIRAIGLMRFTLGGIIDVDSTVAPPLVNGTTYWLKFTRKRSTGDVNFYYAADQATEPSSWTQVGTTVTASTAAMNTGATGMSVMDTSNTALAGTVYRAIVRSGIGGTTVFDADFVAATDYVSSFTESSSNAATVTVTSSTGGALVSQINDKSGNGNHLVQGTAANMPTYQYNATMGKNVLVFDGSNDKLQTSGNITLAQPLQYLLAIKPATTGAGNIVSYTSVTGNPSFFNSGSGALTIYAGTSLSTPGSTIDTAAHQVTVTVNGASSGVRLDGVSKSSGNAGALDYSAVPFGLGGNYATPTYYNGVIMEVVACAAPTTTLRDQCEAYLKAKWGTP